MSSSGSSLGQRVRGGVDFSETAPGKLREATNHHIAPKVTNEPPLAIRAPSTQSQQPSWNQQGVLQARYGQDNIQQGGSNWHVTREHVNPTSRSGRQFSGGKPALNGDYHHPDSVEARVQAATMRSNIQINNILRNTTAGQKTSGRARQYDKLGNYNDAVADFNSLGVQNVQIRPNGTITGQLPDGRKVNVRDRSSERIPTLEIQHSRNEIIKIRYR
jgi:MAFB alternative C-terminus